MPAAELDAVVSQLFAIFRSIYQVAAPGAHDGLAGLRTAYPHLAVVSNHDGTIERTLSELEICQVGEGSGVRIDAVIDSGAVGVAKPDPRIIQIALDRLGVPADQAVHIGDHAGVDVVGARLAGVRPIHFDPYDFCRDGADHAHIRSLRDL